MIAEKVKHIFEWVLWGGWQGGNVGLVVWLNISPQREVISWFTGEVLNVLTGISVIIAIAVGIKKLFFDKPKERKFSKKTRKR